jgi:hypothetical protein
MPVIPDTQEVEAGVCFEASVGKSMRSYLRNKLKSKRTGEMVKEVEHLPSKHEALSSIP